MRKTLSSIPSHTHTMMKAIVVSSLLCISILPEGHAQQASPEKTQQVTPPSDIFFQAYLKLRQGEKHSTKQEYKKAWKNYKAALTYYNTLKTTHPLWKPTVIESRIKSTTKLMNELKPSVKKQLAAERKASAGIISPNNNLELEEVEFTASPEVSQLAKKIKHIQGDLEANKKRYKREITLNEAHLTAAEGKLAILKKNNQANPEKAKKLQKEITRTKALIASAKHYQEQDQKKMKEHLKKLQRELAVYSSAPLLDDIKRYKQRVADKNAELRIVTKTLLKYKAEKIHLAEKLKEKNTTLATANKQIETLTKQLQDQSNISTAVVKKLNTQLKQAEIKQAETDRQLAEAKKHIADLSEKLDQQIQQNQELQEQLKDITEDRNRLARLIQENPDKRIKTVIKQNLALIQQLKESKATLKRVTKDQGKNQDRLLVAERDLAVAKQRILDFQKHSISENRQIKALEQNLQEVTEELAQRSSGGKLSDIERDELISLRKVAKKLLNKQRFINKKYELIRKTVLEQNDNPALVKLFHNDINEQVVTLTDKEKQIINRKVKGHIHKGDLKRLAPGQAEATVARLEKEVSSYLSVSRRMVGRGRYKAAKGILQEANELLPNKFDTLISLGVVNMKTLDLDVAERHLKDGIIMRPNNPHAHYLLGMCHYNKRHDDLAEKSLKKAISLNSAHPNAHFYLGVIAGNRGSTKQAHQHFSNAVIADPDFATAHFALSVNHLSKGEKKQAQDVYQKALKAGLKPHPAHEKNLGLRK